MLVNARPSNEITSGRGQPAVMIKILITLLLTLPFLLPWYYPPYVDFYVDMTVGMLAALLSIYLLVNTYSLKPSILALCLLLFALFLPVQSLLLQYPYVGSTIYTSGFFLLLSILLTALLSVPKYYFQLIIHSVLRGIVILAVIQIVLYATQLFIVDPIVRDKLGWILFAGEGGQVGQRNNFSHIVMWGVISSIVLERMGKLSSWLMWFLIVCSAIVMAHAGSRTVLLYLAVLAIMAGYQWLVATENSTKVFALNVLIALLITLCAQFFVPIMMATIVSTEVSSGTSRLVGGGSYMTRWFEWQKAWLMFLDAPFIGQGWGSYSFNSFWYHDQVATLGDPRENNLFSHCHNLVLQLLAEVGLFGTVLLVVPVGYTLFKAFIKHIEDTITFGLIMICVISLIHSMVELPLWHNNFFIVFFIVFCLIVRQVMSVNDDSMESAARQSGLEPANRKSHLLRKAGILYALFVLIFVGAVLVDHERQVGKAFLVRNDIYNAQNIAIAKQGQYIPFYHKYAQKLEASQVDPDVENAQEMLQSDKLLLDTMFAFPYFTHTAAHIIYLQRMGKSDEAKLWFDKTALYYPRVIPGLIRLTRKYPDELGYLQQHSVEMCKTAVASKMYELQPEHCEVSVIE